MDLHLPPPRNLAKSRLQYIDLYSALSRDDKNHFVCVIPNTPALRHATQTLVSTTSPVLPYLLIYLSLA